LFPGSENNIYLGGVSMEKKRRTYLRTYILFIIIIILLVNVEVVFPLGEDDSSSINITGTISYDGVPLEGARVWIEANPPVVTDSVGRYEACVIPGNIRILARTSTGEFIGERIIKVEQEETATVDFEFTPGTITGIITHNGAPVEGAKVFIGANMPVVTDSEGRYEGQVQSGFVRIFSCTANGEFIGKQKVEIKKGENIKVDFNLIHGTVSGKVVRGGNPLRGAKVFVGANLPITIDALGKFEVCTIVGTIRIFAKSPTGDFIGEKTIVLDEGENTIVNF
jgi:hypothetical protein